VAKLAVHQASFDQSVDRADKLNRGWAPSQPSGLIELIPPAHLLSQLFGAAMGSSFGHDLVIAPQQPVEVVITPKTAI
jgi:hypothetical protein